MSNPETKKTKHLKNNLAGGKTDPDETPNTASDKQILSKGPQTTGNNTVVHNDKRK